MGSRLENIQDSNIIDLAKMQNGQVGEIISWGFHGGKTTPIGDIVQRTKDGLIIIGQQDHAGWEMKKDSAWWKFPGFQIRILMENDRIIITNNTRRNQGD